MTSGTGPIIYNTSFKMSNETLAECVALLTSYLNMISFGSFSFFSQQKLHNMKSLLFIHTEEPIAITVCGRS